MSKTLLGFLFILAGIIYGSLAIDDFYAHTLGWLIEHQWIKPPPIANKDDLVNILGKKATIVFYASILIIIGLFIIWKQ